MIICFYIIKGSMNCPRDLFLTSFRSISFFLYFEPFNKFIIPYNTTIKTIKIGY